MNSSKYYDELYDYALNIVSKYEELLDCNLHVLPKGFFTVSYTHLTLPTIA